MDRRDFIRTLGAAGVVLPAAGFGLSSGGCSAVDGPLRSAAWPALSENPRGYAGLATSLLDEHDYEPSVSGTIPPALEGSLYRNGPALFDRGPDRKRMILDGDGMVHEFRFAGGKAHYRNRFVRTPKFIEEEDAGRFVYPTWSTPVAGGRRANTGLDGPNTSSVTVMRTEEEVIAFDDDQIPFRLRPDSLETIGPWDMGTEAANDYKAHYKIDGVTGDHFFFGTDLARKNTIYTASFDRNMRLKKYWSVPLPRRIYLHDWAITENYVVHIFHPAKISLGRVITKAMGYGTLAGLISWDPSESNLVFIRDRDGANPPVYVEASAIWVWHTLNAYERGGEIIIDFIGSSDVLSGDSEGTTFYSVMRGEDPIARSERSPLIRYIIDTAAGKLKEEVIADENPYEMPFVNQRFVSRQHRYGYVARDGSADRFWSSIARIDTFTGKVEVYDFGPGQYCTEPVFAPIPGHSYEAGDIQEPGWVMSVVYDDTTKCSYLAILNSDRLADGPVARLDLRHHVPMSLHGFWYEGA